MEITYSRLNADELSGATQADYLVSLDGHLRVIDGALTIYDEPAFPVVEFARNLFIWLDDPDRSDFEFDSMSYEEVGSIAVRKNAAGWTIESVFAPGVSSSPLSWTEVESSCRGFISRVAGDLHRLGLDPDDVLGR
ncbi:hypothetical protein [Kribbella sp. CA-247076]|uniref:DUF7878 domain-containing protein n=1 Tax=Kribbella sp. CA-247076 TaxID=3239941 RepID=UPI003D8EA1AE